MWTGAQAREIGLVDELGDFETALTVAKELAGLKPERDYAVLQVRPPQRELLPRPFPFADDLWAASLGLLLDGLRGLARERVWALAPWMVRIWG